MGEDSLRRLFGSRLEDFLEVVWNTSWKSSGSFLAQQSSRSEKPAYPNLDLKNLHIQKRLKDFKTEKNVKNKNFKV